MQPMEWLEVRIEWWEKWIRRWFCRRSGGVVAGERIWGENSDGEEYVAMVRGCEEKTGCNGSGREYVVMECRWSWWSNCTRFWTYFLHHTTSPAMKMVVSYTVHHKSVIWDFFFYSWERAIGSSCPAPLWASSCLGFSRLGPQSPVCATKPSLLIL